MFNKTKKKKKNQSGGKKTTGGKQVEMHHSTLECSYVICVFLNSPTFPLLTHYH